MSTRGLEIFSQAFASLQSDLGKHPELEGAQKLNREMGLMLLMGGRLNSIGEMTKWINGFN